MKTKSKMYWITLGLLLVLITGSAWAQDEEATDETTQEEATEQEATDQEENKNSGWAGMPYAYTGPDTGVGVGFSIIFRDMFGKLGRDTTFTVDYTQTNYSTFSISWDEPQFLHENARGKIELSYENKPARRFFGIGNTAELKDVCNWDYSSVEAIPSYMIRSNDFEWGLTGRWRYNIVTTEDGSLEGSDDKKWERPISEEFPYFYMSHEFEGGVISGPGITLFHDTRNDRFPIGGGRQERIFPIGGGYEEVFLARYDHSVASDFDYTQGYVDLRRFIRLGSDNTILAVRAKLDWTEGDVPFHQYPGDIRGYFNGRYRDKVATNFQVELRQMFEWSREINAIILKPTISNPFIVLFWDEGRVFPELDDVFTEYEGYHYTVGVSGRFIVSPSIVIRADYGWNPEQTTFSVTAGQPF